MEKSKEFTPNFLRSMFVFDNRETPATHWDQLAEGQEYLFTIKEGNRFGSQVLVSFEKVGIIN